MDLTDTQKRILTECAEDDVGLWIVVRTIAADNYDLRVLPAWVRPAVLDFIRDFLSKDLIEAINPDADGRSFYRVSSSVDETLKFIAEEWDTLGTSPPQGGDICWFRATPKGEEVARQLGLLG